jgi:hypothetical protein
MLSTGNYIPLTYLAPIPSPFQVQITIAKLKKYESWGIDQIFAALIQAGGKKLWSEICKFINSVWNK